MNGKVPVRILRVLAVVSALAIGGTYVAWRNAAGEKQRELERAESLQKAAGEEEEEMALMVGSKSPGGPVIGREMTGEEIDDFVENYKGYIKTIPGIPEGAEDVVNEAPLLPGSKSISMPVFSKRDIKKRLEIYDGYAVEVTPPPEDEKKLPKLLPGSKSSIVIPVEPKKPE